MFFNQLRNEPGGEKWGSLIKKRAFDLKNTYVKEWVLLKHVLRLISAYRAVICVYLEDHFLPNGTQYCPSRDYSFRICIHLTAYVTFRAFFFSSSFLLFL